MIIMKQNRGDRISNLLATAIANSHSPFHLFDFDNVKRISMGFADPGPFERQGGRLGGPGAVGKTAGGFRSSSHTKTSQGSFAFAQLRLGALSGVIFLSFAFVFCPAENVE
jgi:hypothetical protein